MADTKQQDDAAKVADDAVKPSKVLSAGSGVENVTVSVDDKPAAEPGHQLAARLEGEVFDPNAARRLAEGRGPGLQDSEAAHPATWVQASDIAAADLVRLQREGNAPKGAKDIRPEGDGS
jgi:hypothetical protein